MSEKLLELVDSNRQRRSVLNNVSLKRKVFSKEKRMEIYLKYNGHCAYCGCILKTKSWAVDHITPFSHGHYEFIVDDNGIKKAVPLDPNRTDNLNPSCFKCNNYKGANTLEQFRTAINNTVNILLNDSRFNRAQSYGLVKLTSQRFSFYFEKQRGLDDKL